MAKTPKTYDDDDNEDKPKAVARDIAPTPTVEVGATSGLPPEDYHTEQYKHGPDPVDPPVPPVPADIVAIGSDEPYPEGSPPPDPFHDPDNPEAAP